MRERQILTSMRLAWRDWKYEIFLSLCAVLALASMLSPIMILLGLKNGVIDGMRSRLMEDPSVLLVTPNSDAGKFSREFIEELTALPGARYAVGRTRESATDLTLVNNGTGKRVSIALEPSSEGEPVLENAGIAVPKNNDSPEIVLSYTAAQSLGASIGDGLGANISRRTPQGKLEAANLFFHVSGILPVEAADRKMGFVALGLLEDLENYRDYLEVPSRGFTGKPHAEERKYASFRLYAKNLGSVNGLAEALADMRIETNTRGREISAIQNMENAINKILLIISLAIGAGFTAFTISSVQGSISRKKRQLAILRLFGMKKAALFFYPLTQVIITAVAGICLSFALYLCVAEVIASVFRSQGNLACHLSVINFFSVCGLVIILSILGCFRAAWKAAAIQPSSIIREN